MIRRPLLFVGLAIVALTVLVARPVAQQPAPPAPASGTSGAAPAGPQQPAPPVAPGPVTTFRAGIDAVSVDASVTDKDGHPVTDLTPEDFEIREGGKVQEIQTFKLVQTNDGRDDPEAQRDIQGFDDEQRETARDDNRLFVIFLDDYHVQLANSMNVRLQLAAFVKQLTPHDLVAIAMPWGTVSALTWSRDHDATAGEIMAFVGRKYNYTPKNPLEEQYANQPPQEQERFRNNITIAALTRLSEYLGTLRDGRKTILYVSEGMTGILPAGVSTIGGPGAGTAVTRGNAGPNANAERMFENASIDADLHAVFVDAARSDTYVYTMDPRGLVGLAYGADMNVSINDSTMMLDDELDNLRIIASNTDGRAIVNSNNLMGSLHQMVQDASTYYLIGYTSSLAPRDGKFHEIQVRVKRKDVLVQARKGYWAYSSDDIARAEAVKSKPGPTEDVTNALDSLATLADPDRRKPVLVWMGAAPGLTAKAHVTLAWEAPPPKDVGDSVDHVTVTATSVSGDELFKGNVPKVDDPTRLAGEVAFDAPPGEVQVHLVAENARGVRVDTDDVSLDVPDFTATHPQITRPFVYRGRTAHDLQVVRAATAPVPTPERSFSRTERILIRFGAYGPAGSTPAMTARLLNQSGGSIATFADPTSLGNHLFESEIPLGGFPPGDYLIELTATSGGDAIKQLLAIRVTG